MKYSLLILIFIPFILFATPSELMKSAYMSSLSIKEFHLTQKALFDICKPEIEDHEKFNKWLISKQSEFALAESIRVLFVNKGVENKGSALKKVFTQHLNTIDSKVAQTIMPFTSAQELDKTKACNNWCDAISNPNSALLLRYKNKIDFLKSNFKEINKAINSASNW
ncbi:hypothetical protein [Colwellia sp. MB3u-55]|uniref:hypothetical protein n=1 Tax=Colwellia sp. MB3u-55 TaxID=2759810 RepID=UPI0015F45918|nr:hypothetical protein [Colwellia sp. MB3u-55]MBA6250821.1 hypothetical protein [Colwellia sp. MB3u-55]